MHVPPVALCFLLISATLFAQPATGFYDDFEDGRPDTIVNDSTFLLWKADHPRTFGITETGGTLQIAYTRTDTSQPWDNFNFTPPIPVDVAFNPVISLKIQSDVSHIFTVKPIYSNGKSRLIQQDIPGDESWHSCSFQLSETNYSGGVLEKIYFYFDGGSSALQSGLVLFDEFRIAGVTVPVNQLEAHLIDSSTVELTWETEDTSLVGHFNVYRGSGPFFPAGEASRIGETRALSYLDTGLVNNTTYFYKVSATDKEDKEHPPASVSIRTSVPGAIPSLEVIPQQTGSVGRYEKVELWVQMSDASYTNPFDPDEIDLYAWFLGPEGDSIKINGFYDNYQAADQWKIRFAAPSEGTWEYRVYATDVDGTGSGAPGTFEVSASEHKGWLRISETNPNYLEHHDGTGFYGIAAYYPWNVTETRLDQFRAVKGNIFGYWDCTYDNEGNGGGRYLLESMDSGLGRYDQRKAARIDQVLSWAEERDMKVMLALWVHPYLRIENVPWDNGQWNEYNPYSTIVEVEDFYTDSVALCYQEKHHRYVLARWGYSRALGIWELINEIHGTSGWVSDRGAAKRWVERVHTYFRENDPYSRPTTASFGGSEGVSHYSENDLLGSMPNVHFYEKHGWPTPYPEDLVRSGLENMVRLARSLKSKGNRPAFLGEAGYYSMLADVETKAYTWEFHNTFWAGLTNGLATTPFWWEFNKADIFTPERMQLYSHLEGFAGDLDLNRHPWTRSDISVRQADGYFMDSGKSGFGWLKTYHGSAAAGSALSIRNTSLENGTCLLEWYDTWSGQFTHTDTTYSVSGLTWAMVPGQTEREDAAFRLRSTEPGGAASRIVLRLVETDTLVPGPFPWSPGEDSLVYKIACFVTDGENLLDVGYAGPVEIKIWAEGLSDSLQLGTELENGGQVFDYPFSDTIPALMVASIPGLGSDTLFLGGATGPLTGIRTLPSPSPELACYPNPFHRETAIVYTVPDAGKVTLTIFDLNGRAVEVLEENIRPAGKHRVIWNSDGYPGGIYFCQFRSGATSRTLKLIVNP